MKVFLGFLLTLIILAGGGYWGYQISVRKESEEAKAIPFTNPFVQKPDTTFTTTQTGTTNPFEESPSPNPFESTESTAYQNPFEALR